MTALKTFAIAGFIGAAAGLAPAASIAASRCGGALSVDAPISLAEVSRRCNVSIAALKEANPGVDPANVRPGARLAIPDETNLGGVPAFDGDGNTSDEGEPPASERVDHAWLGSAQPSAGLRRHNARRSQRIRIRERSSVGAERVLIREQSVNGRSAVPDRLSYQQRSALRIHNAGVPTTLPGFKSSPVRINAPTQAKPSAKLIACTGLENSDNSGAHKNQKIVSEQTNAFSGIEATPNDGFDCRLLHADHAPVDLTPASTTPQPHYGLPVSSSAKYRVPNYNAIGLTGGVSSVSAPATSRFTVSGDIIGHEDGCLLLRSKGGETWGLAAAPAAQTLIGKHVTAWGVEAAKSTCGDARTIVVSHAVYAEPY
ncbi:MAG: hypothetical protein AAGD92_05510 [Pseudomonadota bacterium]